MDANTPEKVPRTTAERKRKRKADDGGGGVPSGSVTSKGARSVAALDNKKINEYFPKHHLGSSPIRHGGAKSPSPQQGYPMVRFKINVNIYKFSQQQFCELCVTSVFSCQQYPPSPQQLLSPQVTTPNSSVAEFSSLMQPPRPHPQPPPPPPPASTQPAGSMVSKQVQVRPTNLNRTSQVRQAKINTPNVSKIR